MVKTLKIISVLLTAIVVAIPYLNPVIAGYLSFMSFLAIPIFILDVVLVFISPKKSHHHHHHSHHRNYWHYIYILVPLSCLIYLYPYFPISKFFLSDDSKAKKMTIVSWNVDNYGLHNDTLQSSSRYIRSLHPDIICLQERPHTSLMAWNKICSQFAEYKYAVKNSREDEVLNLAIFSKYPISGLREYYYPHSYNKSMRVDLNVDGKTIRLFNVHLQTTGVGDGNTDKKHNVITRFYLNAIERNRQADRLAEAIGRSKYPVVLCGDFNDIRASYTYRNLLNNMHDCHLSAGSGWAGSYQNYKSLLKIDYILCSKSLSPMDYEVITNRWSDHKIQLATIKAEEK